MTAADLDQYFPRATREQRIAISAYHDAGWTIESMLPNTDEVAIHRESACDCVDHAWIRPNGHVVSI